VLFFHHRAAEINARLVFRSSQKGTHKTIITGMSLKVCALVAMPDGAVPKVDGFNDTSGHLLATL
jgi:hypothetical protein